MKRLLSALVATALTALIHTGCLLPAMAGEAVSRWQDDDLTLLATTAFASRNVYRGVERSGMAWQAELDGALRGWRGHLWYSDPFKSTEPGELLTSLGYVWTIDKTTTVEASGTHFWYIDQPIQGAASHSFESALQANWNISAFLRFGLKTSYDIRYRSQGVEVSVAQDIALKQWGTFLECRIFAGNLSGRDVLPNTTTTTTRDAYTYAGLDLRLPYRIGPHTTVAVEAHLVETSGQSPAWSPLLRGSGTRSWFSLGASFDF